jgi:molecular chaperone DnaK
MSNKISWFGVDFGTTNSAAVSFTGISQEDLRQLTYGDDEGRPLPSVVSINKKTGEIITGREAKDRKNELLEDYEYFSSIKSIIDKDKVWKIAGNDWTPIDIAAEVFKTLKKMVNESTGDTLDEAVVAVPVGFSALKRANLRKAAFKAGVNIKMFISEPTAAFCSNYAKLKNCKNVAVFDWGGGTLDVAILNISDGKIHELATEGMSVAGNDIDRKLAEKMHYKFIRGKSPIISFDELDSLTKDQLIMKCEKAKCDFSDEDLVTISINKYGNYGAVRDTLDYDFFSLLLESEIQNALYCLEKAIHKSNLNKASLDCILCVGGSSKLRPLREKLESIYGDMVYYPEKVMWDIAKGAAITATKPGCYALNKSIGIILSDGSYFPLLREGQKIPCSEVSYTFATVEGSTEKPQDARFVFTDSENANQRTFTENFVVPMRGFSDEYLKLSCYIDPDFIFKLKVGSNRMHDDVYRVWAYENLKIYYEIESGNDE